MSKADKILSREAGDEQFTVFDWGLTPTAPRSDEFIAFADFGRQSLDPEFAGSLNNASQQARVFEALGKAPDRRELAQQEAGKIIDEAKEAAIRLRKEAQEKGRLEGQQQGLAEHAEGVARLAAILTEIQARRKAILEYYREDILELVKILSERLVHHEISVNPGVILSCFNEAMDFVAQNSLVKAHLNPADFSRLKEAGIGDPGLLGGKDRIQLFEDATISRGGCRLQSGLGEIDATLESRREKLYQTVELAFKAALLKNDKGEE